MSEESPTTQTSTTPLTTLITNLCDKSSNVKRDICGLLSKSEFNDIIASDIKSNGKINKVFLANAIFDLTNIINDIETSVKPVFQSNDTNTNIFKSDIESQIAISSLVAKSIDNALKSHSESVEKQLRDLTEAVSQLNTPSPLSSSEDYCGDSTPPDITHKPVSHELNYISDTVENFITPDVRSELVDFFSKEKFTPEGGHGVVTYGEKYKYMGHKLEPKPFPKCVQKLVDSLNQSKTGGKYELNSCLVNSYEGPESSLSEHSDDEYSINPDTDIFTISLGTPRKVTFKEIITGQETEHTAQPDSLYVMSRESQNIYTHRIDADSSCTGLRYSLTFRSVHWRYLNSTCILGDSNTRSIKFGTGKGTIGASTPGKQVYTPKVEMIDPLSCASYSNVVVAVGANNLKSSDIRNSHDVKRIYVEYKTKIMEIQRLNRGCKIYILPALPTKLMTVNMRIMDFNNLLEHDLPRSCKNVFIVRGVSQLLDRFTGLLSESLSRSRDDFIHINSAGVGLLVRIIKNAIFERKRSTSKIHSNKSYSSAVRGRPNDAPH